VLATDPVFKPGSAEAEKLMTQLDADPPFVRLCRAQESFRARLTPKPWRCGCERPAVRFPREHAHDEERFSEWLQRYDKACDVPRGGGSRLAQGPLARERRAAKGTVNPGGV